MDAAIFQNITVRELEDSRERSVSFSNINLTEELGRTYREEGEANVFFSRLNMLDCILTDQDHGDSRSLSNVTIALSGCNLGDFQINLFRKYTDLVFVSVVAEKITIKLTEPNIRLANLRLDNCKIKELEIIELEAPEELGSRHDLKSTAFKLVGDNSVLKIKYVGYHSHSKRQIKLDFVKESNTSQVIETLEVTNAILGGNQELSPRNTPTYFNINNILLNNVVFSNQRNIVYCKAKLNLNDLTLEGYVQNNLKDDIYEKLVRFNKLLVSKTVAGDEPINLDDWSAEHSMPGVSGIIKRTSCYHSDRRDFKNRLITILEDIGLERGSLRDCLDVIDRVTNSNRELIYSGTIERLNSQLKDISLRAESNRARGSNPYIYSITMDSQGEISAQKTPMRPTPTPPPMPVSTEESRRTGEIKLSVPANIRNPGFDPDFLSNRSPGVSFRNSVLEEELNNINNTTAMARNITLTAEEMARHETRNQMFGRIGIIDSPSSTVSEIMRRNQRNASSLADLGQHLDIDSRILSSWYDEVMATTASRATRSNSHDEIDIFGESDN